MATPPDKPPTKRKRAKPRKKSATASRKPAKTRSSRSVTATGKKLRPEILDQVEKLRATGMPVGRVVRSLAELHNMSERNVHRYIAEIHRQWRERAARNRDDRIAEYDATLQQAAEQAFANTQPAAVVAATRERAKIFGDYPPSNQFQMQVLAQASVNGAEQGNEREHAEATLLVKLQRMLEPAPQPVIDVPSED